MAVKVNYSIIVPVFNSDGSLINLDSRITKVFNEEVKESYELIFIDDASTNPLTKKTLKSIYSNNPKNKTIIFLEKNLGQHKATLLGFKFAKGDYVITLDDDLQHHPEFIPNLLTEKQNDVVIARFVNKKTHIVKRLLSIVKNFLDRNIYNYPHNIQLSSFRLIKAGVAHCMVAKAGNTTYIPSLLIGCTRNIVNVDLLHNKREIGNSNYGLIRVIKFTFSLIPFRKKNKIHKIEHWKIKEVLTLHE